MTLTRRSQNFTGSMVMVLVPNKFVPFYTGLMQKKIDTLYTNIGFWAYIAEKTKIDIVKFLPSSLGPLSVSFHCIAHF